MLNEEKVKLMTRMALYEKNEGKKALKIVRYFRSDYISFNMVKTFISVTIAYAVLIALYVLYRMDYFLENISSLNLKLLVSDVIKGYVVTIIIYLVISFIVYFIKYRDAKKSFKGYYAKLRKMNKIYESESKIKDEIGGIREDDGTTGF